MTQMIPMKSPFVYLCKMGNSWSTNANADATGSTPKGTADNTRTPEKQDNTTIPIKPSTTHHGGDKPVKTQTSRKSQLLVDPGSGSAAMDYTRPQVVKNRKKDEQGISTAAEKSKKPKKIQCYRDIRESNTSIPEVLDSDSETNHQADCPTIKSLLDKSPQKVYTPSLEVDVLTSPKDYTVIVKRSSPPAQSDSKSIAKRKRTTKPSDIDQKRDTSDVPQQDSAVDIDASNTNVTASGADTSKSDDTDGPSLSKRKRPRQKESQETKYYQALQRTFKPRAGLRDASTLRPPQRSDVSKGQAGVNSFKIEKPSVSATRETSSSSSGAGEAMEAHPLITNSLPTRRYLPLLLSTDNCVPPDRIQHPLLNKLKQTETFKLSLTSESDNNNEMLETAPPVADESQHTTEVVKPELTSNGDISSTGIISNIDEQSSDKRDNMMQNDMCQTEQLDAARDPEGADTVPKSEKLRKIIPLGNEPKSQTYPLLTTGSPKIVLRRLEGLVVDKPVNCSEFGEKTDNEASQVLCSDPSPSTADSQQNIAKHQEESKTSEPKKKCRNDKTKKSKTKVKSSKATSVQVTTADTAAESDCKSNQGKNVVLSTSVEQDTKKHLDRNNSVSSRNKRSGLKLLTQQNDYKSDATDSSESYSSPEEKQPPVLKSSTPAPMPQDLVISVGNSVKTGGQRQYQQQSSTNINSQSRVKISHPVPIFLRQDGKLSSTPKPITPEVYRYLVSQGPSSIYPVPPFNKPIGKATPKHPGILDISTKKAFDHTHGNVPSPTALQNHPKVGQSKDSGSIIYISNPGPLPSTNTVSVAGTGNKPDGSNVLPQPILTVNQNVAQSPTKPGTVVDLRTPSEKTQGRQVIVRTTPSNSIPIGVLTSMFQQKNKQTPVFLKAAVSKDCKTFSYGIGVSKPSLITHSPQVTESSSNDTHSPKPPSQNHPMILPAPPKVSEDRDHSYTRVNTEKATSANTTSAPPSTTQMSSTTSTPPQTVGLDLSKNSRKSVKLHLHDRHRSKSDTVCNGSDSVLTHRKTLSPKIPVSNSGGPVLTIPIKVERLDSYEGSADRGKTDPNHPLTVSIGSDMYIIQPKSEKGIGNTGALSETTVTQPSSSSGTQTAADITTQVKKSCKVKLKEKFAKASQSPRDETTIPPFAETLSLLPKNQLRKIKKSKLQRYFSEGKANRPKFRIPSGLDLSPGQRSKHTKSKDQLVRPQPVKKTQSKTFSKVDDVVTSKSAKVVQVFKHSDEECSFYMHHVRINFVKAGANASLHRWFLHSDYPCILHLNESRAVREIDVENLTTGFYIASYMEQDIMKRGFGKPMAISATLAAYPPHIPTLPDGTMALAIGEIHDSMVDPPGGDGHCHRKTGSERMEYVLKLVLEDHCFKDVVNLTDRRYDTTSADMSPRVSTPKFYSQEMFEYFTPKVNGSQVDVRSAGSHMSTGSHSEIIKRLQLKIKQEPVQTPKPASWPFLDTQTRFQEDFEDVPLDLTKPKVEEQAVELADLSRATRSSGRLKEEFDQESIARVKCGNKKQKRN